jgi:uncharacterized membrane-anchored protein YhcB (DUF1043 family)
MDAIKIIGIVFGVLFVGYIAVRLWSSAYFRSKFEASKFNHRKDEKEE